MILHHSVKNTEYEDLANEKKEVLRFIEIVSREVTKAEATATAGREWLAKAKSRLEEIERRLEEIRGA